MKTLAITFTPAARFVLGVVWILTATTTRAAPVWQGHEGREDGILTVYNPATPLSEPSVITPEPQWRIGDDESETLFGLITDARRDDDGTTYLLDAVMSTVYEVDPRGEVLRSLGREGDGPGEFRNATSLALLPDGGVGIVEMMPSHIVVLGRDGLPRPSVELDDGEGGRSHVQRLEVDGTRLVMSMLSTRFNEGKAEIRTVLGTYDLSGALQHKVLHTFAEQSGGSISISSGDDNDFTNNWVLGPDGQIVVYRRTKQYLIETFDERGTPLRRIRRDYTSVRLPEAELEAQREQRERLRARFGTTVEADIEEMARDIDNVIARTNGELWVLSSRGVQDCPAGSIGLFDVFDAQGRFVRQTRIEADYSPDDDRFLIRGDHIFVLKEARNAPDRTMSGGGGMMMVQLSTGGGDDDEDDDVEQRPYEVICYAMPATQ